MRFNLLTFLTLLIFANISFADTYREYRDVRKEISEEEQNLKKIISQKNTLIEKLNALTGSINKSRAILRGINKDIIIIESNLKSIDKEIAVSMKNISNNKMYILLSNKFMVENIRYFPILILLTSKSIKDSIIDVEILAIAINNMSDRISLLRADIERLNKLRDDEVKERSNLLQFQSIQKGELDRIRRLSDEEERLLTLVKNDELARKDYIEQLRSKERELDKILKSQRMRSVDDRTSLFGRSKGKLQLPVDGKIIERFGNVYIRDAEVNIFNKGIKISCDKDSDVKLPYEGQVVFADEVKGLLYIAVIQHDGGYYTVYANMNQLNVKSGDKVKGGDILGMVFDGGYLYFELRRGETAINPSGWFKQ